MSISPRVSVIVPVYNSEQYLQRCLNSITSQSLPDIEIICIDDGSTDGSSLILKEFEAKDKRIKVFTQPNSGQSSARNLGLVKATGEYVGFVDSDDYIDINFYKNLYEEAQNSQCMIVQTSTRRISPKRVKILKQPIQKKSNFINGVKALNHGGVWDKIFKTEMVRNNHLHFANGIIYEDNLFVIQALFYSEGMRVINGDCYNYIYNPLSTTTDPKKQKKRKTDSLIIAKKIMSFIKEQKICLRQSIVVQRFIMMNFVSSEFLEDEIYFQKLIKILGNKYIVGFYKIKYEYKSKLKQIRHKIKAVWNLT